MDSERRDDAEQLCYRLGHLLASRKTIQDQLDVIREQVDAVLDALAPLLPLAGITVNVGTAYSPQIVRIYPDQMGSSCVKEIECDRFGDIRWLSPEAPHPVNPDVNAISVAEAVVAIDDEAA